MGTRVRCECAKTDGKMEKERMEQTVMKTTRLSKLIQIIPDQNKGERSRKRRRRKKIHREKNKKAMA